MKKYTRFLTFLLVLLPFPVLGDISTVKQIEYGTYINSRYGFEVKYPKNILYPGQPSDNNDARGFTSKDKQADMSVEGNHMVVNTWAEEYRWWLDEYKDGKITYRVFNKKYFVFSGSRGNEIFYVRVLYLGPDDNPVDLIFEFTYPKKEKAFWDPVAAACAKSLKPSKILVPNNYDIGGLGTNTDQFR